MATTHRMIELGDTPERLTNPGLHTGKDITIQNQGPSNVFIGGDDSVADNNFGYKLVPDQAISFELSGRDTLYVVSTTAGSIVSVLDMSLEQGE